MEVKKTGIKEKIIIPKDIDEISEFVNKKAEELINQISKDYKRKLTKKVISQCLEEFKINYFHFIFTKYKETTKETIKETIKDNWINIKSKDELTKYTVVNLKSFCQEVGLSQTGIKGVIIERLWNYIKSL